MIINFEVNGEKFKAYKKVLWVSQILHIAGKKAGVNINDKSSYYLTVIGKGKDDGLRYNNLSDEVKLYDKIKFIATYKGKTGIAEHVKLLNNLNFVFKDNLNFVFKKCKKIMKILFTLLLLFLLTGCAGGVDTSLLKPLTHNNKLALTLYNYNITTCKVECLADYHNSVEYDHILTKETEEFLECPLDHRVFVCKDIHTKKQYLMTPAQWQKDAQFLFHYFHTPTIKKYLAQHGFLCDQDFAKCENQYEVIKTLEEFIYEAN